MASSDPQTPALTAQALADITHLHTLLHLFHYRNNLQHRHSTWYRGFQIFRRHLKRLLGSYKLLAQVPDTATARHKKKAQDAQTRQTLAAELDLWVDQLVPRTWRAFSQVAADNRFAVLGVFLLAVLAQVCGLLGLLDRIDDAANEDMVKVLQRFEHEVWDQHEVLGEPAPARIRGIEDHGERILRYDEQDATAVGPAAHGVPNQSHSTAQFSVKSIQESRPESGAEVNQLKDGSKVKKSSSTKSLKRAASKAHKDRPKKKSKSSNAIDNLFDGL